ncbi:MAG TPA: flagellar biosynthetic protein FliO [Gammaproteobacteria bacterium]|nr:flagellar biosynthetic protein FliO [Gammaproteobacteria bacterium]
MVVKKTMSLWIVQAISLTLAPVASAWATDAPADLSQGVSPDYFLKLVVAMCVVLGVFFALAWLVKRVHRLPMSTQSIQVLGSTAVGNREKLVLVQVGEQQLLLGVTTQSIQNLHTLEAPLAEDNPSPAPNFGDVFKKAFSPRKDT